MSKITIEEAKRLSILKWKWIVKNNGKQDGLTEALPELAWLHSGCGLCEYTRQRIPKGPNEYREYKQCPHCPLYKIDGNKSCFDNDSVFILWYQKMWDKESCIDEAKAVLAAIRKIKVPSERIIDKIIHPVSTKFGAPMGRSDVGEKPTDKRIYDSKVPFVDGAYDRGGAYWGSPDNLRVAYTKDLSYIHFYRTY